ncbi:MAG: AAA family ATPase [Propionibacteriaceae bacterium]|nr:AAA family ATPase [Propionibacteriaceae bacterium]
MTPTNSLSPVCAVFLRSNGVGEVLINQRSTPISCSDLTTARKKSIEILIHEAQHYANPLMVICSDPDGLFRLVVSADGTVTEAPRDMKAVAPTGSIYVTEPLPLPPSSPLLHPQPFESQPNQPQDMDPRRDFSEELGSVPAEQGWRGALTRRGIPVPPSDSEMADRAHRSAVAQQWPEPRTIAVVNGKGGAGKTPTTICLAAVFARFGGSGVLAWDNNQTRGTLGWRTEQGPHQATLLDLLPAITSLLEADAQATNIDQYVHHQSRDMFDVLRSKSVILADEQRITPYDVDAIWRVATKYYRLIIMDSGNDESDPMWRRMIDHTDQLVTATTTRADHAEAGALLLEALMRRNEHSAYLAQNSVTVITQSDPKASEESIRRIRGGYLSLSRSVVHIPYDPGMLEGTLYFDNLKPATQRAWLTAGAAVATGLGPLTGLE